MNELYPNLSYYMLVSSNIKSDLCNSNCKPDDIHLHRILQEQQLLNPLLFYTMATPTAEDVQTSRVSGILSRMLVESVDSSYSHPISIREKE